MPSSASPRPARSSASLSGTTSAIGSAFQAAPPFHASPTSFAAEVSPPDRLPPPRGFAPGTQAFRKLLILRGIGSVSQPAVPCPTGPGTGSRPQQTGRLFLPVELDKSGVAGRLVDAFTSGLPASMDVVAKVRVLSVRCCQQQSAAVVAWA